jgi:hypothetical protein
MLRNALRRHEVALCHTLSGGALWRRLSHGMDCGIFTAVTRKRRKSLVERRMRYPPSVDGSAIGSASIVSADDDGRGKCAGAFDTTITNPGSCCILGGRPTASSLICSSAFDAATLAILLLSWSRTAQSRWNVFARSLSRKIPNSARSNPMTCGFLSAARSEWSVIPAAFAASARRAPDHTIGVI